MVNINLQTKQFIMPAANITIVAVASLADTACIILAEGVTLDASVIETANAKGVNILAAGMPAYETAMALGSRF